MSEIVLLSQAPLGTDANSIENAIRPALAKYGYPQGIVSGNMSSIGDLTVSRLYGSGEAQFKYQMPQDIFWEINGKDLQGSSKPIPAIHLTYSLDALRENSITYESLGSLTRRGLDISVFEYLADNYVVVTFYPTDRLKETARLEELKYTYSRQNWQTF